MSTAVSLVAALVMMAVDMDPKLASRFSDVEIDEDFRPYLAANVLLMEV